jgi:hypothetical protein
MDDRVTGDIILKRRIHDTSVLSGARDHDRPKPELG